MEHYPTCSKCGNSEPSVQAHGRNKRMLCMSCRGVNTEQTFCIYCQKNYDTFERLQRHLRRAHKGSVAQINLAPTKGE